VQTDLRVLPPEQHYEDLHSDKQQLSLSGWGQDYQEAYNFLSILGSGFYGETPINSDEINGLLYQSLLTLDNDKREVIYGEIERINQDDVLRVPLTFSRDAALVSPDLEGYEYTGSIGHPSRWLRFRNNGF